LRRRDAARLPLRQRIEREWVKVGFGLLKMCLSRRALLLVVGD
jgi:hypothetical protein